MKDKKLDSDQQEIYDKYVAKMVDNGFYFKDSIKHYLLSYIAPRYQKTFLIFILLITIPVSYSLITEVSKLLPIKQPLPIVINAKDSTTYYPLIKTLRRNYDPEVISINDMVSRYLIESYISNRESYDFRSGDINDINNKLKYIRNNSSAKEYRNFKKSFDRENPSSPVRYFGKNSYSKVNISFVKFIRDKNKNLVKMAQNFLYFNLSKEAIIDYNIITYFGDKKTIKNKKVKISFTFSGINEKSGKLRKKLDFTVNNFVNL